jgi:thioredoxin reductase (NADPH)
MNFDVAVVGAGPTGLACGIELGRRGLGSVIFDKGCILNSLYNYPTHMTFFTTPEYLEIGEIPMTSIGDKPTRAEALKYYRKVAEHYRLNVRQYERVDYFEGTDGAFVLHTVDRLGCSNQYEVRKIVLATGYYDKPNRLGAPGEDLDKVIYYYKEAHPYYDMDVAVVGGANSAAIAALELFRAGARVTLIHREHTVSRHVKYWIRPDLENRIKAGEIAAHFDSRVVEVRPESIRVVTPEGEITLKNDFVFAMIGYHPDIDFLAAHGILLEPGLERPYTNPETLETHRRGVYLAGVIVAGMHTNEIFIENGRLHGKKIAAAIARSLRPAA